MYIGACIGEMQVRYFNVLNAYSRGKFRMYVKFTLKRLLKKSTWKACETWLRLCTVFPHVFLTSSWSLFVKSDVCTVTSRRTIRFFDRKPSTGRWWRSWAYFLNRGWWSTFHWKNSSLKQILVYLLYTAVSKHPPVEFSSRMSDWHFSIWNRWKCTLNGSTRKSPLITRSQKVYAQSPRK